MRIFRGAIAAPLAVAILLLSAARPVAADSVSQVSLGGLGANDVVDWTTLGKTPGALLTTSFSASSTNGVSVQSSETGGRFAIAEQSMGWSGHFPANTIIINDQFPSTPVTFTFSTPVKGFGLTVDCAFAGSFTGTISVYNGATLLGTYTSPSTSGTTLFLGMRITRALTSPRPL